MPLACWDEKECFSIYSRINYICRRLLARDDQATKQRSTNHLLVSYQHTCQSLNSYYPQPFFRNSINSSLCFLLVWFSALVCMCSILPCLGQQKWSVDPYQKGSNTTRKRTEWHYLQESILLTTNANSKSSATLIPMPSLDSEADRHTRLPHKQNSCMWVVYSLFSKRSAHVDHIVLVGIVWPSRAP